MNAATELVRAEELDEQRREGLIKFLARMFDLSSAYTNLLIGLGYGGFFTVWSFTKDHLGKRESIVAALSISVSLLLFILFEVLMLFVLNVLNLQNVEKLIKASNVAELVKVQGEIERSENRRKRWLIKLWIPVFITCVITGIFGACVLIRRFVLVLIFGH